MNPLDLVSEPCECPEKGVALMVAFFAVVIFAILPIAALVITIHDMIQHYAHTERRTCYLSGSERTSWQQVRRRYKKCDTDIAFIPWN
jgi:hypothetical protein